MVKHVLFCLYTAARLMIFCIGCSGDMVTIKARPVESRAAQPVVVSDTLAADTLADSLSRDHREEFSQYLRDALMLFRQQHYEQSLSSLRSAVAIDPNNWEPYYVLGLVKTHTGDFGAAEAFLTESLKLAPGTNHLRSQIYLAQAENFEAQARYSRARLSYQTALNLHPESQSARHGLARLDAQHKLSDR